MSGFDLPDLPFDQYQRYRCLADILALLSLDDDSAVLDIGGYSCLSSDEDFPLLPPFLPDYRSVVLDQPFCGMPGYVQGDGLCLPFADRAFPCVVSVDTLEHIPPDARGVFLDEMLRVAGRYVILAAPFADELTSAAERTVFDYSAAVLGIGHPQIGEHLTLGLPDLVKWRSHLGAQGWEVIEIANGYLPRWLPMMLMRHYLLSLPGGEELCQRFDRLYNTVFFPIDQRSPSYRRVLVASRFPGTLEWVQQVFAESASAAGVADASRRFILSPIWDDISRCVRQREVELDETIARLQARVAAFERGRFIRLMRWLDRQKRRLRKRFRGDIHA